MIGASLLLKDWLARKPTSEIVSQVAGLVELAMQ